ncbi:hypothetical protein LCGC14_1797300, partial [marine sediment metagenome]
MLSTNRRIPLILAVITGLAMVLVTSWQGYSVWQAQRVQADESGGPSAQQLAKKPSVPSEPLAAFEFFGSAPKP